MSLRTIAILLVLLAGVAWWIVRDDAQAEILDAHRRLAAALSKADGEADPLSILEIQAVRGLFADTCVISGDAGDQAGAFTPEELTRNVLAMREYFRRVEMTFSQPEISFPADDEALSEFVATLTAAGGAADAAEVFETRRISARLRNPDGAWVFAEFRLAAMPDP